jgi:hypothetical protein
MLHRKLYTIVLLSALLVLKQGFFSVNAEQTVSFCDPTKDRNFEHIIACYHLKVNDITNQQIANLKLFHKAINPRRQEEDSGLPTLNATQQKDLLKPVTHYDNRAGNKQSIIEECTRAINTIKNIHPQCLLTLSIKQFYDSEQEVQEFIRKPVNRTQAAMYNSYWAQHKTDLLDMLQANVMMYNQMFMSYPIHSSILQMQDQAKLIVDELDKTVDIIKHIPNKFDNASTTECI